MGNDQDILNAAEENNQPGKDSLEGRISGLKSKAYAAFGVCLASLAAIKAADYIDNETVQYMVHGISFFGILVGFYAGEYLYSKARDYEWELNAHKSMPDAKQPPLYNKNLNPI